MLVTCTKEAFNVIELICAVDCVIIRSRCALV